MQSKHLQHLAGVERRRIVTPANVVLRLNRLERPAPWPAELIEEMQRTAPFELVQQYPNYPPFYERLARFVGVPAESLVVGAGIEEFIRTLMASCFGRNAATLWPTCAMFDVYARAFGVHLERIGVDPHRHLSAAEVCSRLPAQLGVLFLANPGQPVETYFNTAELQQIAEACAQRGAVLAVDEAYHGFGSGTAVALAQDLENVVVLRTFSKAFGAAGIRLGYAVGSGRMLKALDAVRQSGEVSALSMHVATVLLDRFEAYVQPGVKVICDGRDWLRERVAAGLGFPVWGQHANHVLIDFRSVERLRKVAAALEQRGVYTKANFGGRLDRHMLVTCGERALMERFYAELRTAVLVNE